MARLRSNFKAGTLSADITNVATSISSASFAALPVVADGDYLIIILDPLGAAGNPEIVKVIAHPSLSTSVTSIRGQEGSSARSHLAGTVWRHGPTSLDFPKYEVREVNVLDYGALPSFAEPSGAVMTANTAAFQAAIDAARDPMGVGSGGDETALYTVVCPSTELGAMYWINDSLNNENVRIRGDLTGVDINLFGWSRKVWINGTNIPSPDPVFRMDRSSGGGIFNYSNFQDIGIAGNTCAIKPYFGAVGDNAGLVLDNVDLFVNTVAHADNAPIVAVDFFWLIWRRGGCRTGTAKPAVILRSEENGVIPYLIKLEDLIWDGGGLKVENNTTVPGSISGAWDIDNVTTENQVSGDPFLNVVCDPAAALKEITGVRINNCQRADADDGAGAFIRVDGQSNITLDDFIITNCSAYTEYWLEVYDTSLSAFAIQGSHASIGLLDPASTGSLYNVEYQHSQSHSRISDFGVDRLIVDGQSDGTRFGYSGDSYARTVVGPTGVKFGPGSDEADVWLHRISADIVRFDFIDGAAGDVWINSPSGTNPNLTFGIDDAIAAIVYAHSGTGELRIYHAGDVIRVDTGKIGFLGAAPVVRQTLGVAAVDPATTMTLVNNIRQALINLGLGQT